MARADHAAGADIQDGDEIEPALASQDTGCISDPGLVGTADGEVWQSVGGDRAAVLAVGRARPILGALPGEEPLLAHEAGDAIAPTGAAQRLSQPRTAIGLATARKLLSNPPAQMRGFELPRAGLAPALDPIVIAALARPGGPRTTKPLCIGRSSVRSGHTSGRHFGEDAQ